MGELAISIEQASSEIRGLARSLTALELISTCPVWPSRGHLSENGQQFYDLIASTGKEYVLAIVDRAFDRALEIAAPWGELLNIWVDGEMIESPEPERNEANQKMLAVFNYYCDVLADWGKIQKK